MGGSTTSCPTWRGRRCARLQRVGALPLAEAVRLLREVADALAYAHARGVVLRDLKPENVLLSGGHAVIAAFGIAIAVEAATQPGNEDAPRLTATGVIAYEALTGAHPFGARTVTALVAAHLTEVPTTIRTLAVLPFVNTGGNAADDYFGDGMTDELAHALARLPGLHVTGRTSSYPFKGKTATAQEIGHALDVSALVEGTLRRADDRLRVTTQLVGAADGKVLWDSVYESRSSDVFGVQDHFTRAVVAALASTLGTRPSDAPLVDVGRGTTDLEAYQLYLKGRYYWLARGAENVTRSIDFFQQAIARDQAFARAHAGLALAYSTLSVYIPDPVDSLSTLVASSAERAMALDSMLADAQIATAVMLNMRLRFSEAALHYREAVALEPSNQYAHHALGHFLVMVGHTGDGAPRPSPRRVASWRSIPLFCSRTKRSGSRKASVDSRTAVQPDSAVRSLERARQLDPDQPGLFGKLIFAYASAGRWADAERIRTELHRLDGDRSGGVDVAFADFVFGDREAHARLLTTAVGQRRWQERCQRSAAAATSAHMATFIPSTPSARIGRPHPPMPCDGTPFPDLAVPSVGARTSTVNWRQYDVRHFHSRPGGGKEGRAVRGAGVAPGGARARRGAGPCRRLGRVSHGRDHPPR